jgi:hypothetical protein
MGGWLVVYEGGIRPFGGGIICYFTSIDCAAESHEGPSNIWKSTRLRWIMIKAFDNSRYWFLDVPV